MRAPSASVPSSTRRPPISSMSASVALPTRRTPATYQATVRNAVVLASRLAVVSRSMISLLRRSRRNACTARMPFIDSTKCTISRATVLRVRR